MRKLVKMINSKGRFRSAFLLFGIWFLATQVQAKKDINREFEELWSKIPDQVAEVEPRIRTFLTHVEAERSDSVLVKAFVLMGRANYFLGRYRISLQYYQKALKRPEIEQMPALKMVVLLGIGVDNELLEKLEESLKYNLQAIRYAEQRKDSVSLMKAWINRGMLEYKKSKYKTAVDYTLQALRLAEYQRDSAKIALCYQNLNIIYTSPEKAKEKDYYGQKALEIYRRLGNPYSLGQQLVNLSFDCLEKGDFQGSENFAKEALEISLQIGAPDIEVVARGVLGKVLNSKGKRKDAKDMVLRALSIAKEIERIDLQEDILLKIIDFLVQDGDYTQYQKYQNELIAVREQMEQEAFKSQYEEYQVLYELDKAEEKNLLLSQENRILGIQRNWLISIIALVVLATTVLGIQYRKLRKAHTSIFNLNLENGLQSVASQTKPEVEPSNEEQLVQDGNAVVVHPESDETFKRYQEILRQVEGNRYFTDPELNLAKLSQIIGTNQKYISEAINKHSQTSFSVFINRMRVAEARRLLVQHPESLLTDVMESSGFTNRVTFYRQFKELAGLSPSEFQQMLLSKSKHLAG